MFLNDNKQFITAFNKEFKTWDTSTFTCLKTDMDPTNINNFLFL